MKRLTAEEVASDMARLAEIGEIYSGWTTHAAYEHSRDLVRANLIPQWQDEPTEDTHARCPWWWCEDCGPESPPQLLRCYRPLKAMPHGDLTVDCQSPKEWSRWTVAGWVPLVGRVCSIGERPS